MDSSRGDTDQDVALGHLRTVDKVVLFDSADSETGDIVFLGVVHAGHFGGFTADQSATGLTTTFGHAGHDGLDHSGLVLADGHVIKEQQRFGALSQNVVDAHRNGVDTHRVVDAHLERQFQFRTHAVGAAHQNRVTVAKASEVEHAAESSDAAHAAGTVGRFYMLLDAAHYFISCFEVNA